MYQDRPKDLKPEENTSPLIGGSLPSPESGHTSSQSPLARQAQYEACYNSKERWVPGFAKALSSLSGPEEIAAFVDCWRQNHTDSENDTPRAVQSLIVAGWESFDQDKHDLSTTLQEFEAAVALLYQLNQNPSSFPEEILYELEFSLIYTLSTLSDIYRANNSPDVALALCDEALRSPLFSESLQLSEEHERQLLLCKIQIYLTKSHSHYTSGEMEESNTALGTALGLTELMSEESCIELSNIFLQEVTFSWYNEQFERAASLFQFTLKLFEKFDSNALPISTEENKSQINFLRQATQIASLLSHTDKAIQFGTAVCDELFQRFEPLFQLEHPLMDPSVVQEDYTQLQRDGMILSKLFMVAGRHFDAERILRRTIRIHDCIKEHSNSRQSLIVHFTLARHLNFMARTGEARNLVLPLMEEAFVKLPSFMKTSLLNLPTSGNPLERSLPIEIPTSALSLEEMGQNLILIAQGSELLAECYHIDSFQAESRAEYHELTAIQGTLLTRASFVLAILTQISKNTDLHTKVVELSIREKVTLEDFERALSFLSVFIKEKKGHSLPTSSEEELQRYLKAKVALSFGKVDRGLRLLEKQYKSLPEGATIPRSELLLEIAELELDRDNPDRAVSHVQEALQAHEKHTITAHPLYLKHVNLLLRLSEAGPEDRFEQLRNQAAFCQYELDTHPASIVHRLEDPWVIFRMD